MKTKGIFVTGATIAAAAVLTFGGFALADQGSTVAPAGPPTVQPSTIDSTSGANLSPTTSEPAEETEPTPAPTPTETAAPPSPVPTIAPPVFPNGEVSQYDGPTTGPANGSVGDTPLGPPPMRTMVPGSLEE